MTFSSLDLSYQILNCIVLLLNAWNFDYSNQYFHAPTFTTTLIVYVLAPLHLSISPNFIYDRRRYWRWDSLFVFYRRRELVARVKARCRSFHGNLTEKFLFGAVNLLCFSWFRLQEMTLVSTPLLIYPWLTAHSTFLVIHTGFPMSAHLIQAAVRSQYVFLWLNLAVTPAHEF